MRWLSSLFALLVVSASGGCNSAGSTTAVADEDILVLRALMTSACTSEWRQVVSDVPIEPFRRVVSDRGAANVQFGLNLDVRSPAAAKWPRGEVCATVQVVDDTVVKEVLSRETRIPPRWTLFREQFADAKRLMRVSLPVYSADGCSAVVYAEGTCPYTCGAGFFYELRKDRAEWTILRTKNASNP
jgi:hypothetical protein